MDDNTKGSADNTDSGRSTSRPLSQSELTARYRWVIVMLIMVTIPHLRLVVGIVKSTEYRMTTDRIKEPNWELPEQIIATKEKKASILQENSEKTAKSYILARRYWLLGVAVCAALGVIEWFV